ncbi:unnamed protein product [Trichogramma brassicae]|uniref:Uncharacterized protein n=1 Tax=Trichogramma brassicae TaxID=86971 RepID=A0A6H5IYA9_9HYME|nr:unnamed protein product [Trichogramma brassicae]
MEYNKIVRSCQSARTGRTREEATNRAKIRLHLSGIRHRAKLSRESTLQARNIIISESAWMLYTARSSNNGGSGSSKSNCTFMWYRQAESDERRALGSLSRLAQRGRVRLNTGRAERAPSVRHRLRHAIRFSLLASGAARHTPL